eukprot:gene16302-biopygen20264
MVAPADVSPATLFCSHAWEGSFADEVEALEYSRKSQIKTGKSRLGPTKKTGGKSREHSRLHIVLVSTFQKMRSEVVQQHLRRRPMDYHGISFTSIHSQRKQCPLCWMRTKTTPLWDVIRFQPLYTV